jgi:hypothetical protein
VTDIERGRHWGTRVGHSLDVVAEMPRYVDDDSIVIGLRVAAVDAFFIHYRGLIEFLTDEENKRYIRSGDYLGASTCQRSTPSRPLSAWRNSGDDLAISARTNLTRPTSTNAVSSTHRRKCRPRSRRDVTDTEEVTASIPASFVGGLVTRRQPWSNEA